MPSNQIKEETIGYRCERAALFTIGILMVKNILFVNSFTTAYQGVINAFLAVVIMLIFIWAAKEVVQRRCVTVMTVFFATALFIVIQLLMFPENNVYFVARLPRIIFFGIIPFLLVTSAEDFDYLLAGFKKCSYIILAASFGSMLLLYATHDLQSAEYSMSFGNCVAVGTIFLEHYALKEKKPIDILLVLYGIVAIVIAGSRGPLLGIGCYFVFHILMISNHRKIKDLLLDSSIMGVGIVLYMNYLTILTWMYEVLDKRGIQSRTLLLVVTGQGSQDSGRHDVYAYSIDLLQRHPLLGIGYNGLMGNGYEDMTPHNTYLEFVLYYGIILGGAAVICLAYLWVRGVLRNRDTAVNCLCIIFFALYVPRSFVGAGGLESPDFWMLLAASIASARISMEKRRQKIRATVLGVRTERTRRGKIREIENGMS